MTFDSWCCEKDTSSRWTDDGNGDADAMRLVGLSSASRLASLAVAPAPAEPLPKSVWTAGVGDTGAAVGAF
eukprot:1959634-Prymnesium_polylepis.1